MPAPSTVPLSAAPSPSCEPKRAPAARLRSGRGTKATVHSPYATANTTAAAAPFSCGGQPSASSFCGWKSSTVAAAATSSVTSRDSRDHGESSALVQRAARPVGAAANSGAANSAEPSSVATAGGVAVAVPPERVVASSIRRH
jgi:hypothetical protein